MSELNQYGKVKKGGLKLKGGLSLSHDKTKKKKKKKKKKRKRNEEEDVKKNSDKTNVRKDDRTPAEIEYDEKNEARELERLKKMAKLTHRETIDQYNNYLASLSEHHDVPKVGNAGMG